VSEKKKQPSRGHLSFARRIVYSFRENLLKETGNGDPEQGTRRGIREWKKRVSEGGGQYNF
jgi:hypothetical protein